MMRLHYERSLQTVIKCLVCNYYWCLIKRTDVFYFSLLLWRYSPCLGLGLLPWNSPFHFSLLDLRHSVGSLGRVISSSQGLYLYTNTEKRTCTHKHQTSMPWEGFETTIPVTERAKTVHALDRSVTVTDIYSTWFKILVLLFSEMSAQAQVQS
jgi:hypothetical protein